MLLHCLCSSVTNANAHFSTNANAHCNISALNLIGPRAMDVLSELSYVSMTPEHFPSLFCKVGHHTFCDDATGLIQLSTVILCCSV